MTDRPVRSLRIDGHLIEIRPITPEDAPGLQKFHDQLSDRSVYLRYLVPKPVLTDSDAARLTGVDHHNREAFVAVLNDDIIGVGRFDTLPAMGSRQGHVSSDASPSCDTPVEAEVAFVIADAWQGRGIGRYLLECLADTARTRGLQRFVAEVHPSNGRMLALFRSWPLGCEVTHEQGTVEVALPLCAPVTGTATANDERMRP